MHLKGIVQVTQKWHRNFGRPSSFMDPYHFDQLKKCLALNSDVIFVFLGQFAVICIHHFSKGVDILK